MERDCEANSSYAVLAMGTSRFMQCRLGRGGHRIAGRQCIPRPLFSVIPSSLSAPVFEFPTSSSETTHTHLQPSQPRSRLARLTHDKPV